MTPSYLKLFNQEHLITIQYEDLNAIWELEEYLPRMKDDLYKQLKSDIKKNGLNDPVLYYVTEEGVKIVIEGHTRLIACKELKRTDIPTKEIKENFTSLEDIQLWMLKHQFQRRNLSNVEKLKLAYLSKDIIEKQAKENLSKAGKGVGVDEHIDTTQEIAKIAGVGRTTVARYTSVIGSSSEKIVDKMLKGEISISLAHTMVENDKKKSESKTNQTKDTKSTSQPEIQYVNSYDEGKLLIENKEIEFLIVSKSKDILENLIKNKKAKYAVFIA